MQTRIADGIQCNEQDGQGLSGDDKWLEIIEDNCWDIRCVNVPTGGDDYDVGWRVIEHYMAEPNERIIGHGSSPLKALNDAISKSRS